MTLEETLKRMNEVLGMTPEQLEAAKKDAADADGSTENSSSENNQKEDDGKEIQAKKADTGTIYMGLANKGQTTQQPQNVNGVNVWTGDKEGSVLNGKKFIHPTKGAQILTSDKSDLLTTGQVEVNLKNGKGTAKVPFIGVKADNQGNPDPNGQQAIPTDIDTIQKLEQGETKDLVVSNGNAMQAIGDDQKALATVDKETKELATQEGGELATTNSGLPLAQEDAKALQTINNEITQISQQLPQMTETGMYEDISNIYQKYLNNPSVILQDKQTVKDDIEKMQKGEQISDPVVPPDNSNKPEKPKGGDGNSHTPGKGNPFDGLKKVGGLIGGLLGGIAKLAGMFVGGVAAGQANGKR